MPNYRTRCPAPWVAALVLLLGARAGAAVHAPLSAVDTARLLAGRVGVAGGTEPWREEHLAPYRAVQSERWAQWEEAIGAKMGVWAAEHLERTPGETVFYPFSGPDLATVHRLYPNAARYVFVAYERAGRLPRLHELTQARFRRVLRHFRRGMRVFLSRGFFVTDQMEALFLDREAALEGVLGALLFFAEREGLEVTAIEPLRIAHSGEALERHPDDPTLRSTWDSVRLHLRRREDGHVLVLDYVRMDLRDCQLRQRRHTIRWLRRVAQNRVLFKAASHLAQRHEFGIIRDAVADGARSIVQDESGLAWVLLDQHFETRLFGSFRRFLKRFAAGPAMPLREAYQTRADVLPLRFRFGYYKRGPTCLIYAHRRRAAVR